MTQIVHLWPLTGDRTTTCCGLMPLGLSVTRYAEVTCPGCLDILNDSYARKLDEYIVDRVLRRVLGS